MAASPVLPLALLAGSICSICAVFLVADWHRPRIWRAFPMVPADFGQGEITWEEQPGPVKLGIIAFSEAELFAKLDGRPAEIHDPGRPIAARLWRLVLRYR